MRSKLGLPATVSCWVLLLLAVLGHRQHRQGGVAQDRKRQQHPA